MTSQRHPWPRMKPATRPQSGLETSGCKTWSVSWFLPGDLLATEGRRDVFAHRKAIRQAIKGRIQSIVKASAEAGASQFLNTCKKPENGCGAASEDSPRREPWGTCWKISKPRQGDKRHSPGRGERRSWVAGFFRRCAALARFPAAHGLRRGLPSIATPWLGTRAKIDMRPGP